MKIFVTGASGLTGTHFVKAALAAGHETGVLKTRLHDRAGILSEVRAFGPEQVVHLAAISASSAAPLDYYDVNVVGTLNLLDALCELPVPPARVLLMSSANVYGNTGDAPIAETRLPAPVDHYGMSKLAMEYMSRAYLPRLPVVIGRPFNYTGVAQRNDFVVAKLTALFAARAPQIELGRLDVVREFVDVRFVCAALLGLLENGQPGEVYNICRGEAHDVQEVLDLLRQLTGHSPSVVSHPALLRHSDIACLRGDPARLNATVGPLPGPALPDTLRWMLAAQPERPA